MLVANRTIPTDEWQLQKQPQAAAVRSQWQRQGSCDSGDGSNSTGIWQTAAESSFWKQVLEAAAAAVVADSMMSRHINSHEAARWDAAF